MTGTTMKKALAGRGGGDKTSLAPKTPGHQNTQYGSECALKDPQGSRYELQKAHLARLIWAAGTGLHSKAVAGERCQVDSSTKFQAKLAKTDCGHELC